MNDLVDSVLTWIGFEGALTVWLLTCTAMCAYLVVRDSVTEEDE